MQTSLLPAMFDLMSASVVTLDLRDQIQSGRDPFSCIMGAVAHLEDRQELLLVVPFEPVPLYGVMAQKGFTHQATPCENGDWQVLFSPASEPERAVIDVDARGLEPPEPLVKILEALQALPDGAELRAHTDRKPVHLYPQVEERGFIAESIEQPDGSYITTIVQRLD